MAQVEERLGILEAAQRLHTMVTEKHQERMEELQALLAETRRDSRQTQRLWVRLCEKYGWLDDVDLDEYRGSAGA